MGIRPFVGAAVIAIGICSSARAQDPQQVFGPMMDFMNQALEDAQRRNSPEYQMQEVQPGGLTRGQVTVLQQLLIQRGYDVGAPDGIVGPKTMAVVAQLQFKAGVPATGLPDQQLLEALLQGQ